MSAYDVIRRTALSDIEELGLDPDEDPAAIAAVVASVVDGYQTRAHVGIEAPLGNPHAVADRIVSSIVAFGPLTDLLGLGDVEEVFIEGDQVTFVDTTGRLQHLAVPVTQGDTSHLVARLLADSDRRLDVSSPIVQARVLDGSARLTAVIPPVADRLSATIRRYALRRETLDHLVELGALSQAAARFLGLTMQVGSSLLISGPPGAGKTSLLAALLAAAPPSHCIRCVEEVRELSVPLPPHSSFYQARPAGIDGRGSVSVRDLVKLVLAMRPDRIVVGEVRGSEAFELTRASNAGCGFCCTIHSNSARAALDALVNSALMAGENVTEPVVRNVFSSTIDLVVHVDRDSGGGGEQIRREVAEILAVRPSLGERFTTEPVFIRTAPGRPLEWSGALPDDELRTRIERESGVPLHDVCAGLR